MVFSPDYKEYERKLNEEIVPLLSQFAEFSSSQDNSNYPKVIWLYQYPTLDFWGSNVGGNVFINSENIHHYNLIVQRVLR